MKRRRKKPPRKSRRRMHRNRRRLLARRRDYGSRRGRPLPEDLRGVTIDDTHTRTGGKP